MKRISSRIHRIRLHLLKGTAVSVARVTYNIETVPEFLYNGWL